MKLRKLTALLLGAAVLASAAVPMASAEAADVNVNLQEEYISRSGDSEDDEAIPATFGEDGSVTLTVKEGPSAGAGRFMMWSKIDDPVINLAETPYLCWEVTGTANFGFALRWDKNEGNEDTCYRIQIARGHETDGLAPEKSSINFLDLLKDNDLGLVYTKDEITMITTALNVFGDTGDSATFKIWFSANPVGEEQNPSDQTNPTPTTAPTTADEPADTTAPTANNTTKKNNPSTGEASQAAAAAVVLAVAATGAVVLMKKKNG